MSRSALLSFKSKRTPTQNAMASFLVMFVAFWAFGALPTQWFAARYQYDPNLGDALVRTALFAMYMPTDWIFWGWRLADVESIKSDVHVMLMLGLSSIMLSIGFAIFVSFRLSRYTPGMEGLHGSAHWAEQEDVNKTGFLSAPGYTAQGVVVGAIMKDRGGRIIHPHHAKYHKRYKPIMIRDKDAKGLRRFRKIEKRNSEGVPMFAIRKSVIATLETLRDGGNTHIFAFCPTRSGKGVGLVIPTLLMMPCSVLTHDPKGEAYALTAGFRRAAGNWVMKFEPSCTDGTSARWNPLDEIRAHTVHDVSDTQMIMTMVCDPKGEGLEDHWAKTSFAFLVGVALHLRYKGGRCASLAGIETFLSDPRWDTDMQIYEEMLSYEHDPEGKMGWVDGSGNPVKTHPAVAKAAKVMSIKEDRERSGVLSTAISFFSLYSDETIAKNTSRSDFLVRDLMTNEKPVSLYYIVGPSDMERMTPLTRLFFALFIRRNAADMEFENGATKKNYTHPMLMIIDEMPALKKLPILQEALGYVAGYGIRMFMLSQDIKQVEDLFGDKQTIASGSATRIIYAPQDDETAEKIAKMLGQTTITEEKVSHSKDMIGLKAGSVSVNTDKIGRDLMTGAELMALSMYDMVVFRAGQSPIYARKAFFYENPILVGRSKIPAPITSDILRKPEPVKSPQEVEKTAAPATAADKWADARSAFKASIDQVVTPEKISAAVTEQVERRKSSRYADKKPILTDADRAAIQRLTQNVAVVQKVETVEAF